MEDSAKLLLSVPTHGMHPSEALILLSVSIPERALGAALGEFRSCSDVGKAM